MSSIRKFWKERQSALNSGDVSADDREFIGATLAVLYVTHLMIVFMLS
jgi:hypothetical protein